MGLTITEQQLSGSEALTGTQLLSLPSPMGTVVMCAFRDWYVVRALNRV